MTNSNKALAMRLVDMNSYRIESVVSGIGHLTVKAMWSHLDALRASLTKAGFQHRVRDDGALVIETAS